MPNKQEEKDQSRRSGVKSIASNGVKSSQTLHVSAPESESIVVNTFIILSMNLGSLRCEYVMEIMTKFLIFIMFSRTILLCTKWM